MVVHKLQKIVKGLTMPKIISVREKTLLDYKNQDYLRAIEPAATEVKMMFSDHEVLVLIIWALVSPSAALAYLIWKKYERLRWLAIPLIVVSIFQFIGQWGGFFWLWDKFVYGTYAVR